MNETTSKAMSGPVRLPAGFQWRVGAHGGMVWSLLDANIAATHGACLNDEE